MKTAHDGKLGLIALVAIVVSSMIGGGVYSLPQNMAQYSAAGPALIAWIITGVGIFFVANSLRILANARPDLQAGIYMYAHEGFSPFVGFLVAWGYWLMTIFGNVAFAVILMDALDQFFPGRFTGGGNLNSIICGSILIWGYYYLVTRGVTTVGAANIIGTIAKLIPLVIFILIVGWAFDSANLSHDYWGSDPQTVKSLGPVSHQITNPLLITLWMFVGIEGAVVMSGNARNSKDIGRATLIGLFLSLFIYIGLSLLPYTVASQAELAKLSTPSTAGVLKMMIGKTGELIMSIGMIISVMTGWLAWTMLCAEIPMAAAINGTFPKFFAKKNAHGAAGNSLLVSSAIMQLAMVLLWFSSNAWNTMVNLTSVMVIPAYLASTLFLFNSALNGRKSAGGGTMLALISSGIGVLFCLLMIYFSDPIYTMMIPIMMTIGIPLYLYASMNTKSGPFNFSRKDLFYLIILLAVDAVVMLYMNHIGL